MANDELILQSMHGSVLLMKLNRPDAMNAMSRELSDALHDGLAAADVDPEVRAIVLTGVGKAFCAGADVGHGRGVSPGSADEMLHQWWPSDIQTPKSLMSIMEMETPVIGAINGWALGKGFWYTLACDITIAGESAVFGQPEIRHISQTSFLFPALVGWKVAHRYSLTGDHFDAQEALRIGVVNEVVPDDELLDRAMALADRITKVPRAAVRVNKAITTRGLQAAGLSAGLNVGSALGTIAHASTDSPEMRELHKVRAEQGVREFIRQRDEPFQPEPGGPRSKR